VLADGDISCRLEACIAGQGKSCPDRTAFSRHCQGSRSRGCNSRRQATVIRDELYNFLTLILLASSSSSYTQAPNHAWTTFELRRTMMIPEELFSEFERKSSNCLSYILLRININLLPATKSTCTMGLFPQIDRAWIALNNKLFLWDYVTSYVLDGLIFSSFPEIQLRF